MGDGTTMLKEGDIIELKEGHDVYAEVPMHFLYINKRGVFDETAMGHIRIGGELNYFAGRYVVYKTATDGGGLGHGAGDFYPNGHHVFCEKLDNPKLRVNFYQTGSFTAMIPYIDPVGVAVRSWKDVS